MRKDDQRPSDDPIEESSSQHPTQDGRSTDVRRHVKARPTRIGKYEIEDKLGTGGMGEVYRAFDSTLNRFVALKILYADSPDSIRRFLEEARIQAGIEHENICKVYEAGEEDGKNYIAMQLIKGKTLIDAAKEMTEEQKLIVLCQVADALESAHQKGLIHRDIKPANIMVERNENGILKPYICDFGLARANASPGFTMTGMVLGSPPYMAPEQARSETKLMDARTDVYALGATLYEMLTGKPLYAGKTLAEILVQILGDEPAPVRNSEFSLPQDLETIVSRCVEKNPAQRYQSARSLSEDLRRYLDHEPIVARQTAITSVWVRKARKNKAATIGFTLVALVILVSVALFLQSRADAERRAKLIAEFGNEVRFVESQLRSAYAAPLHDVRGQVNEIKKRLKKIENKISTEGKPAFGPGYDALGQSYIAIGDYKKAQEFLEKAWNSGHQEASTAYALGIVMGKSYQDALSKADRLPSAGLRKLKRKEAEEQYGKKAVEYLKKGSSHTESPIYVEALIELYERRYENALKKSQEAFRVISWPYEAKKLEGDIDLEIARTAQQSGDYKKALNVFDSAEKAYSEAEELARSNEEIYIAKGLGFNAATYVQWETGVLDDKYFFKAVESCNKALIAHPGSGSAYLCLSEAHLSQANNLKAWTGQDPTDLFHKAIELAERAEPTDFAVDALIAGGKAYLGIAERATEVRKDPRDYLGKAIKKSEKADELDPHSSAFHTIAASYFLLGDYLMLHGQDPQAALKKVVEIYHDGRKDVSRAEYMQNVVGLAFLSMGEYRLKQGENPQAEFDKSLSYFKRGLEINPESHFIASNIGLCYITLAQFELSRGNDPSKYCAEALRYYDISMQKQREAYAENNKGLAYLHLAEYQLRTNKDPNSYLTKAIDTFQSAIQLNPNINFSNVNLASALVQRAEYKIRMNQDPADEFQRAEENLAKAFSSADDFYEAHRVLGEIQILKARSAILKKRSPLNDLLAARKSISESIRINPLDAVSYVGMTQTYRWEALSDETAAVKAVESGLDWIRKSKEKKITDPKLTALEGFFHLILARNDQDRLNNAQTASSLLNKAFESNPLLRSEYSTYLEEAMNLAKRAS